MELKNSTRGLIAIFCCIVFSWSTSNADTSTHWEPAGYSGGGLFLQIVVDPVETNVVYLGSDGAGMYKSTDHGETWSSINVGLVSREIAGIDMDPSNHLQLWLGTPTGLYKSQNGGSSWSLVNADIHCFKHVNYHAIDISRDGQTILVASHDLAGDTDGSGSGNFSGKLYRSPDGGATWRVIRQFPGTRIPSVMFDPYTSNRAFLLVVGQGVLRSMDGGLTWEDFSTALPSGLNLKNLDIGQTTVYITAAPTRPFKSGKDSAAWESIRTNLQEEDTDDSNFDPIRVSPSSDNTVYLAHAGWPSVFYKSTNGGQSWVGTEVSGHYRFDTINAPHQTWNNPFQGATCIAIDPSNSNRLYYTTWWGVWRSDDGGINWTEKVVGAQNTCCTDVEFIDNTLLSSHMDTGVLRSVDQGAHWLPGFPQEGQDTGLIDLHAWGIERGADGKIYSGLATNLGPRVYRSDDNGVSWQNKSGGLPAAAANVVDNQDIFLVSLAADPNNSGTLYVGIDNLLENGLFRTTNYGDTWVQLSNPPGSGTSIENVLIKCLEVDPTDSNRLFAGLYWDGLWYSEDGGQSWYLARGNNVNLDNSSVQMIVAREDGTVFAAYDDGLYKSVDHGHTFSRTFPVLQNLGENTIEYVESIAFNPADTNEIFVSTAKRYPLWFNRGSVWRTNNGGADWTEITGDLPVRNVVDLAYRNGYLYAATWCANVYRTNISSIQSTPTCQVNLRSDNPSYSPGDTMNILADITCNTTVDIYLVLLDPDGWMISCIYPDDVNWNNQVVSYFRNVPLNGYWRNIPIFRFPFESDDTLGMYTGYLVFTRSGSDPSRFANWLAYSSMTFSLNPQQ
ncbi:MAG: hypothetical protein JRI22_01625 [Deltaproteobacteria bacterium]|nr:hypothetical protein [Deltaproteobacteria bacterium]